MNKFYWNQQLEQIINDNVEEANIKQAILYNSIYVKTQTGNSNVKVSVLVIYYYTQTSPNNIDHFRVSGGQESAHGLVWSSASRSLTSCSQGAAWACSHLKAQLSKRITFPSSVMRLSVKSISSWAVGLKIAVPHWLLCYLETNLNPCHLGLSTTATCFIKVRKTRRQEREC